ncbi:site-specific recombinase%2C DNA invertase Pin [Mycobacterium tuberculosis]|nr:site-specific recombinase%2C DNA invertase Pin [Mycobacterium tuberculosis]
MALIGLVRVSTDKQNTQRQHDALDPICLKVFEEKISGKLATDDRPALLNALSHIRDGDMLTVQEVDRLGRNLLEGLIVLNDLFQRGVAVKVLEGIAAGEHTERSLILDLALALSEDRRRDIVRKTKNGLEAARRRGRVGGRRPVVDDDKRAAILARRERGESIRTIAAGVKVSVGVVHKTLAQAQAPDEPEAPLDGAPVGAADVVGQDGEGQDDAAGQRQEEERRWRRALKPIGVDVAGAEGYRGALWPDDDWGRYHVAAPGGDRLGYVEKERTGWEARDTGSHLIDHRLRTRARAVAALVRRHRERTPHSDVPVDGLPDGWRLTQTLAEYDDGQWRLIAPGGEIAGTISRASYGGRRAEWRATAGDPGRVTAYRATVLPDADDPARGSDSDLWRTRAAAVRALAARHDPELDPAP